MVKLNLGNEKSYLDYSSKLQFIIVRSQGMNRGGTVKECCLLACSHGLLSLLSYTSLSYLPMGDNTYNGPPTSIMNQEKPLQNAQ